MALQASGPISFSQISNEFGLPSGKNLGAYRISQTVGDLTRPLDDGIPTSGTIQFSNFYSKRLNVVVYCSGNRITARSRYNDNNNVTVIGGYKTRPESSSGTKVWIYTNETIGSNIPASSAPNREYCSLITGGWEGGTDLRLDIGTSGVVSGAGGNGGSGSSGGGGSGSKGTSAIGVNYQPITITNRGRIQGGSGGGGGGGGADALIRRRNSRGSSLAYASGGGGGGGQGSPAGSGGGGGGGGSGWRVESITNPSPGNAGNINANGSGGSGGRTTSFGGCTAQGGSGGSGGNPGGNGSSTTGGNAYGGGPSGPSGYGIIITNDGTGVTISNAGSITPEIVYNTGVA